MLFLIGNFYKDERTTNNSDEVITLPWRPIKIEIINDHDTNTLQFKFNKGESYGSLFALESICTQMNSKTIRVKGDACPIRIRAWG